VIEPARLTEVPVSPFPSRCASVWTALEKAEMSFPGRPRIVCVPHRVRAWRAAACAARARGTRTSRCSDGRVTAVLVIAGSDSSGGAGLVQDVRTLARFGARVMCAVMR